MARLNDSEMQARCAETLIGLARFKRARVTLALVALLVLGGRAAEVRAQPFDDLSGLGFPSQTFLGPLIAALSFADVDGDGLDEFVRSGGTSAPALYRRTTRTGPFAVVAGAFPIAPSVGLDIAGHTFFDMDGDGDEDLIFLHKKKNILLENRGGVFVDVTESKLPALEGESISATAADLDGDGDLDLFVGRYLDRADFPMHSCQTNLLLENDGTGRFQDVSAAAGLSAVRGCTLITTVVDLDGDHQLDLIAVNDFGNYIDGQEVWLNTGRLTYREVSKEIGFDLPNYGMGIALGDLDGNGWLDAAVTNIGEIADLEIGADGRFHDASTRRNALVRYAADNNQATWAAAYEDVDGDGNLDLVLASGFLTVFSTFTAGNPQQSLILKGQGDGTYVEAPLSATFPDPNHNARDLKFEDLDGDGRAEIVFGHVTNRVTAHRQRNDTPRPTNITLVPSLTAPGAAGARVVGTCGGATRSRLLMGGAFYGNADRGAVRMTWPAPCDRVNEVATVAVTWPSGFVSVHEVRSGSSVTLEEPNWLRVVVDPGGNGLSVRVDLRAHAGEVVEPELDGEGVVGGPMVLVEPGVWEGTLGLEQGRTEGVIDLYVGGELMGVHPKVRAPEFMARPLIVPPTPITGSSFDVWTTPGATVTFDGAVMVAGANGKVTMPAQAAAGVKSLVVSRAESVTVSEWPVVVDRPAAQSRSELMVRDHIIKASEVATKDVLVRVRLLNANGALANVALSEVGLQVNGVAVPVNPVRQGDWILVKAAHKDVSSGATVQATVFGERWFEPVRVAQLADVTQVGALVDLSRSKCIVNEPRIWRDGQDRGTLFANFRDSAGQRVTDFGLTATWSTSNASVLSTTPLGIGSYTGVVRAGTGEMTVGAMLGSQAVPLPCPITSVPRPPLPEPSSVQVTDLNYGVWSVGVSRWFRLIPRSLAGRALGSGVRLVIVPDQGTVQSEPEYVGLGRYEVRLTPSAGPRMTLRIYTESGALIAQPVFDVYDPNPPVVEPEPEAEVAEVVEELAEDTFVFADAEDVWEPMDDSGPVEDAAGDTLGALDTEPAPLDTEPAPLDTEPAPADTEPPPMDTEPADTEPSPVDTEPADTEPSPVDTRVDDLGAGDSGADIVGPALEVDPDGDVHGVGDEGSEIEGDTGGQLGTDAGVDAADMDGAPSFDATSDAGPGDDTSDGAGDVGAAPDVVDAAMTDTTAVDAVLASDSSGNGDTETEDATKGDAALASDADEVSGPADSAADTREVDALTDTEAEGPDLSESTRGSGKGCEGAPANVGALLGLLGLLGLRSRRRAR